MGHLRNIAVSMPFYPLLRDMRLKSLQNREYRRWRRNGRPMPPPHRAKQMVLKEYAERYQLDTLVETGTYFGDMVKAMLNVFTTIHTIELSSELCAKARERFKAEPAVHVIEGDSGKEMGNLIPRLDSPTLFWLDGHYSGGNTAKGDLDTPIINELTLIFDGRGDANDVILIDDARCFGTDAGYPTLDELKTFVKSKKPQHGVENDMDIIRITPPN